MIQHELELTLPENMHQWVGHCADPCTSKMRNGELPPVRKLHRNNIIRSHAQAMKANGDTIYHRVEFVVSERPHVAAVELGRCKGEFVAIGCDRFVE